MKKEILNGVLLSGIFSLMISCNSKKEESAATVVDKEQIKKDQKNLNIQNRQLKEH